MSLLTSSQLAELAGITRRQAQRILDRGTPNLGARRTPGGHWEIPDTSAVRTWARNHQRWKRKGIAKKSGLNPEDKSRAIVTIEGMRQSFDLWHRKMRDEIPKWNPAQVEKAMELLEPQVDLFFQLEAMRESLQSRK